jgi:replicative DNA helicase
MERGMGVPKPWVVDERALIHGVLRDEDLLDIAAYVTPEDFAAEAHGAIWRVCQEAHKRGQPVTPLVVGQMLRRLLVDMPDKANDAAEYVEKLHAAPQEISPDEASHLAENIVRYATMRRSVEELEGLLSLARGNDQRFFGEVKRFGEGVGSLRRKETVVSWSDSITETLEELEAQQNGLLPPYVKTGIPSLDHQEVFRRGEMVVLAGRPSTGKTAFALQVALASARRQSPVLFASLEMRDKRLVRRALSAESGVPAGAIRRADMTAEQWNVIKIRAEEQRLWKMHTLSKGRVTYDQVLSEARRLKAGDDLALIVIDYFQIMRQAPKKGHDPLTTLQELSADIKNMAVDLDVCVLLLSQLNRVHAGHDGARPTIADLKATGALEQDADVVLLLSPDLREWEYAEWKNEKNRPVLLDLAKSRDGDVMDIPLTFFADNVRFGETSEYERIVIPDGSEVSGVVSEDPAAPRISQDAINWEKWA